MLTLPPKKTRTQLLPPLYHLSIFHLKEIVTLQVSNLDSWATLNIPKNKLPHLTTMYSYRNIVLSRSEVNPEMNFLKTSISYFRIVKEFYRIQKTTDFLKILNCTWIYHKICPKTRNHYITLIPVRDNVPSLKRSVTSSTIQ